VQWRPQRLSQDLAGRMLNRNHLDSYTIVRFPTIAERAPSLYSKLLFSTSHMQLPLRLLALPPLRANKR
jgi:hypothetical protein